MANTRIIAAVLCGLVALLSGWKGWTCSATEIALKIVPSESHQ